MKKTRIVSLEQEEPKSNVVWEVTKILGVPIIISVVVTYLLFCLILLCIWFISWDASIGSFNIAEWHPSVRASYIGAVLGCIATNLTPEDKWKGKKPTNRSTKHSRY